MIKRTTLLFALVALSCALHAGTLPTLEITPAGGAAIANGIIYALPGQTVGWGFEISSDTNYFLESWDSINVLSDPSVGTFTDYLTPYLDSFVSQGGLALGPGNEPVFIEQPFSQGGLSGIGALTVSNSAPQGAQFQALVSINYQLFTTDPNGSDFDGNLVTDANGNQLTDALLMAPITVQMVPEPASALCLLPGALGWLLMRRRRG